MTKHKTYFNWSTGKDSALALYHILQNDIYAIDELITTVNSHHNRVTMHGLRTELLIAQTNALNIKSSLIELPEQPDMEVYNEIMNTSVQQLKQNGFTHSVFGDIFLEDLKTYREKQLAIHGIKTVFPIWKRNTRELIHEFLDLGFKSVIVCASAKYFNEDFVGTIIDRDFIGNLPKEVDPCGENGEFHTFCFDGPIFKKPVPFTIGKKVYREYKNPDKDGANPQSGFWYCDLIPA